MGKGKGYGINREIMNDHQKFKALLDEVGLTREELAALMGMKYTSMTNQLAPAKELPKWAKSVLIFYERWLESDSRKVPMKDKQNN